MSDTQMKGGLRTVGVAEIEQYVFVSVIVRGGSLVVAFLVMVAACGSATATSEVRPFEEVQASEFSFEADLMNPNLGIFGVTTTEPQPSR
ncbi:MAG TPA: hypothetical protein VE569_04975 [Acidimicrobiia bacterium]|jgi:hypothetical protein|nr:hypothetical protein [Acidimicrobiia bacterium]